MNVIKLLISDEWRYWHRTRLAITVLIIGLFITLASVIVNTMEIRHAAHERGRLQKTSEETFLEQPDRHPHRMVHYGHYVFRTPTPLSIIEPGVDAYTGTSIFLEGHRQNSAMFAEQRQSSGMTRFSSLTPSFLLQVLSPLIIIIMGYASITREKEAGTLNIMITQGVSKWDILSSKVIALFIGSFALLLPVVLMSVWAGIAGESWLAIIVFLTGYLLYLFVWSCLIVAISAVNAKGSASFASLLCIWVLICILVPRIGSSSAASIQPSAGKIEADFAVLEELRKLGDGHNAGDPAFEQLRKNLLAKYGVNDVEQLPINFRGVVASYSEEKLTKVLNKFAEQRMAEELTQAQVARNFGWLSPTVAIRSLSMIVAGTSLETHHRFLREAEDLRFEFVQGLNKIHEEVLDYQTDINRYSSDEAGKAARVDAANWQILSEFSFQAESGFDRVRKSLLHAFQLIVWGFIVFLMLSFSVRKLSK